MEVDTLGAFGKHHPHHIIPFTVPFAYWRVAPRACHLSRYCSI